MCSKSSKILFNVHRHGTGLFMTTTIIWQRISKEGVINNFLTGVYKQSVKHVLKLWPDLPKEVLYTQSLKIHFYCHLLATSMDQQHMCLILLELEQSAITQASFSSLSDVHECSSGLEMVQSSLGKQTADCESPHD